jgi:hypothetical protein
VLAKLNRVKKPVLSKTFFFKDYTIEIVWFWGWFKDLVTFKRRTYDGKLFAIRRIYVLHWISAKSWNRCSDRDAIVKEIHIWPLNLTILKSGRQLFLQGRGFDNRKSS